MELRERRPGNYVSVDRPELRARHQFAGVQYSVERGRELAGPVADEEPELVNSIAEIHHKVGDLLCGPPAVWVGGRAEDVDVAATGLQQCPFTGGSDLELVV